MLNLIKNGNEIERRFLVKELPVLDNYKSYNIIQYYLNDKVTRLRKINNDKYILTQKSGSGMARTEIEYELDKNNFDNLKLGATSYITKTRYVIPLNDNLVAELDVFTGNHSGIIICEVEFDSIESASNFVPPFWFGLEVTLDKNLSNKQMSKNYQKALAYYKKLV